MSTLPTDLRNQLERAIVTAREAAETGARAALEALAVHDKEPYPHMDPGQRELRNKLRARARQMGDRQDPPGRLAIDHLVGECAYEHWHRMLFARFLAENSLLIEPEMGVPISLAEAEELAKEDGLDVWAFASRCAQSMLPQIFRPDDPLLQVPLATEHRIKLERLLASLPPAIFTASDALGWVYQFWQSKKKDEVNRSEVKIGADELPAVTQLFTEPYMVEFLLHNTIGAWWAGKKLSENPDWADQAQNEDELRHKVALPGVTWDYLRFVRISPSEGEGRGEGGDEGNSGPWRPAAGTFDGWPKAARDIKGLDPCCGSGHFLVAALRHLVPIRMAEEGLSTAEAIDAVIHDNLHGLEIDERCCQIAAFALAFAAWTFPNLPSPPGRGAGGEGNILGFRKLPDLHIACSGIGPQCSAEEWLDLAEQSGMPTDPRECAEIKNGLLYLHQLFSYAPILGSLINPTQLERDPFTTDYETVQPYLMAVLSAEKSDDETRERAIAAAGMVRAANFLCNKYTLIITNVPYLKHGNQNSTLLNFSTKHHKDAKACLSTTFVDRCRGLIDSQATMAAVVPQPWLFLTSYKSFRRCMLERYQWDILGRLGHSAFETITGHVVDVILLVFTDQRSDRFGFFLDAAEAQNPRAKVQAIRTDRLLPLNRETQLGNPEARVVFGHLARGCLLNEFADSIHGQGSFDDPSFVRSFWELPGLIQGWIYQQTSSSQHGMDAGCSNVFLWEGGCGRLAANMAFKAKEGYSSGKWRAGQKAWGKPGFAVSGMGQLYVNRYQGGSFDTNVAVIFPKNLSHYKAIWAYCRSPEFIANVRKIDRKPKVTPNTFGKVPFDLTHWKKIAEEEYPNDLPEPESDDPTQWLFHGRPEHALTPSPSPRGRGETVLQVEVARLLGYRWPAELDEKMRLSKRARELVQMCEELLPFADDDGIVCIPSVRGEDPAPNRLLTLLAASGIETGRVRGLTGGADLDDWLRNSFFEGHCKLFHDRPFIWHIWDGRKRDGFHALVNYHKLAAGDGKGRKLLETLTYSYLGEWITRQKDGVKQGEGGAEDRLAAALELQKRLEAILEGEPPFDIFVRWKPLHQQPIGWEPDINDGVRLNIRPFLASDLPNGKKGAGILRYKPNIKWGKDRGKEPQRPKDEYPWFWGWDEKTMNFQGGSEFDGNRWNDCHYTNITKQATRDRAKKGGK